MRITVTAHPNAKKPRIETDLFGTLHVYVKEPPLEGRANHAVREALATYLNVKRNTIQLVSGEKAKQKTFEMTEVA